MTEKMKPSGIAWIGDIPTGWKVKKIKYYTYIVNGSTPDSSDLNCWDGPIKWITPADMDNTGIIYEGERTLTQYGYNSCGTSMLPKGSVVVSSRAPIGKINITGDVLCTNQGCKSLVGETDNRYLYYLLLAGQEELVRLGRGTTFVELSTHDLSNFGIVLPESAERTAIADFLDIQCAKIDSVIADIEKQIETLQKYKKSLITEAVTKGLDRSVPMKDSGIEWAQRIPAHWQTTRMQEVGKYKKGPFGSAITLDMFIEKDETAIKIYEQKNAIQGDATLGWYYISERDFGALTDFEVFPGDIIVSCAGTIGKCYIMPETMERGIINQALMKITLSDEVDRDYFLSLFDVALEYMAEKYSNGSAIKNIPPFSVLKKQHIPLPNIEEQKKIASYIRQKGGLLDDLLKEKTQQLQVMQDHKKSLIYEYVTGKNK